MNRRFPGSAGGVPLGVSASRRLTYFCALALFPLPTAPQGFDQPPVLEFPEPGLDDPDAYQGYRTRFYHDSEGNAFQVYLDARSGRVVSLWANAANESAGFTVRDAAGQPAAVDWGGREARAWAAEAAAAAEATRSVEYRLRAVAPEIVIGTFVLGSMRVERDVQYQQRHLAPFDSQTARLPELETLIANVERLPADERQRHLALLRAESPAELRRRLAPAIACNAAEDGRWSCTVEHRSLDGHDQLTLRFSGDPRESSAVVADRTVRIRAQSRRAIGLTVRLSTTQAPLTPLTRQEIFNDQFRRFYQQVRADSAARPLRFRRLERQVRGLELVSYREKLMAGLPNFATYFGRDMLMAALMMEPIWSPTMLEHVIASVLAKLSPAGEVSHEEGLGGQAIRENAGRYNALLDAYQRTGADSLLTSARSVLENLQAVQENYRMLDDDLQFPVVAARYLRHRDVPVEQKRRFLLARRAPNDTTSHLTLLLRNLAYVAERTAPYARDPRADNLIAFPPLEDQSGWFPGSWRDSRVGYAGGRYAMDINVIWAPAALAAAAGILALLDSLGLASGTPPGPLMDALEAWRGTARHFTVVLPPDEAGRRIDAKLSWLPELEARYWREILSRHPVPDSGVRFLALAIDAEGEPIPVVNSDPALAVFLAGGPAPELEWILELFQRRYPAGLLVDGLGPLVANDAYATRDVWGMFQRDQYHSPRVVWGREVNLLLLGLAKQLAALGPPADFAAQAYAARLEALFMQTLVAVEASGVHHHELWSYQIHDGRLRPVRYGTSSDVQLWNLTDLAVQYIVTQIPALAAGAR